MYQWQCLYRVPWYLGYLANIENQVLKLLYVFTNMYEWQKSACMPKSDDRTLHCHGVINVQIAKYHIMTSQQIQRMTTLYFVYLGTHLNMDYNLWTAHKLPVYNQTFTSIWFWSSNILQAIFFLFHDLFFNVIFRYCNALPYVFGPVVAIFPLFTVYSSTFVYTYTLLDLWVHNESG